MLTLSERPETAAARVQRHRPHAVDVGSGVVSPRLSVVPLYVSWEWHERKYNWSTRKGNKVVRRQWDLEVSRQKEDEEYRWIWTANYPSDSKQYFLFFG